MSGSPTTPTPLARALADLVDEAVAVHGDLGVAPERLVLRLEERLRQRLADAGAGRPGAPIEEVEVFTLLGRTCGVDLVLALAWEEGSEAAWARYAAVLHPQVHAAARRQGANEAEARALADGLPGDLVADPRTLAGYHGRGPLAGFLSVIVRRRVIDARRGAVGESLEERHAPVDASAGPEGAATSSETLARLGQALAPLVDELTDREAAVLLLKYKNEMSQREIARALGVSDSRVTRLVQHAFEKLAQRLRSAFPDGEPEDFPGLSRVWNELDSLRSSRQRQGSSPDPSAGAPGPNGTTSW